jgi:ABC-2 type transport system permease protein
LATYVYGVFQAATGLAYAFGAWTVFFASRYVRRGELDALLLLAPDPRMSLPFANFELVGALSGYAIALIGLRAGARLTVLNAAVTVAGIACGGAATYSLFMAAATMSLYTKQSSAAIGFAMDLVLFGQYPMNLYPGAMRTLFTWILPIVLIANAPARLVDAGPGLPAAVLAAAALALAGANALFKHALGRFIRHW